MKRITIDVVQSWGPCSRYDRKLLEKLVNGRSYITRRGIAKLNIPREDRLWALLHCLSEKQQHEIACDFAEIVLYLVEDDDRPRVAIETKRRWILGKASDRELDAARAAARDAARYAAGAAARYAAGAAVRDAAWAAAWAAGDAAGAAAGDAAWAAAWDEMYDKFIKMAVEK